MKMRESGYDPAIREFRIIDSGIEVAPTFASAEAILTGIAHSSSSSVTSGVSPSPVFETGAPPLSGQQP